jgi:hypothetical protein
VEPPVATFPRRIVDRVKRSSRRRHAVVAAFSQRHRAGAITSREATVALMAATEKQLELRRNTSRSDRLGCLRCPLRPTQTCFC